MASSPLGDIVTPIGIFNFVSDVPEELLTKSVCPITTSADAPLCVGSSLKTSTLLFILSVTINLPSKDTSEYHGPFNLLAAIPLELL